MKSRGCGDVHRHVRGEVGVAHHDHRVSGGLASAGFASAGLAASGPFTAATRPRPPRWAAAVAALRFASCGPPWPSRCRCRPRPAALAGLHDRQGGDASGAGPPYRAGERNAVSVSKRSLIGERGTSRHRRVVARPDELAEPLASTMTSRPASRPTASPGLPGAAATGGVAGRRVEHEQQLAALPSTPRWRPAPAAADRRSAPPRPAPCGSAPRSLDERQPLDAVVLALEAPLWRVAVRSCCRVALAMPLQE